MTYGVSNKSVSINIVLVSFHTKYKIFGAKQIVEINQEANVISLINYDHLDKHVNTYNNNKCVINKQSHKNKIFI